MKKCTSCTKDLPDAALHCVFCGAKQATAPAPAPNNAKTVMGFSSDAVLDQLRAAQAQAQAAQTPPAPAPAPAASPFAASTVIADPATLQPAGFSTSPAALPSAVPQAQAQAKTMFASGPPPELLAAQQQQLHQHAQPAPMPVSSSGLAPLAPASSAQAKTMVPEGMLSPFAASTVIEQPMAAAPMSPPHPEQPMSRVHSGGGGFPSMIPPAPVGPVANVQPMFQNNNAAGGGYAMPGQQNPYGAPAPQGSAGRPIEPWAQSLRMLMFIVGGLLAIAFVLPWSTEPMMFSWDAIIHGEGLAKLGPLFIGAAALIALVAAAAPMPSAVRGVIALVLGLAGLAIPIVMNHGDLGWQQLVELGGLSCVVIGLLIRSEYHDSVMPRILATLGALAVLSLLVIPRGGEIPLVSLIKSLGAGGGIANLVGVILSLAFVALMVCSLFVWMPAPNGGFPKVVMWLVIAWPVIDFLWLIANAGLGEIKSSPASALAWLIGGGHGGGEPFPVAYAVLLAYGGATVFGKSLET